AICGTRPGSLLSNRASWRAWGTHLHEQKEAAVNTAATNNTAVQGESQEQASHHHHRFHVTVRLLPAGPEAKFQLPENAALLEVLEEGAKHLHLDLLPPAPERPLDRLHVLSHHHHVGPAIDNLDQPLGTYLKEKGTTPHFGIELVL